MEGRPVVPPTQLSLLLTLTAPFPSHPAAEEVNRLQRLCMAAVSRRRNREIRLLSSSILSRSLSA